MNNFIQASADNARKDKAFKVKAGAFERSNPHIVNDRQNLPIQPHIEHQQIVERPPPIVQIPSVAPIQCKRFEKITRHYQEQNLEQRSFSNALPGLSVDESDDDIDESEFDNDQIVERPVG